MPGKKTTIFFFAMLLLPLINTAQSYKFDFGPGKTQPGYIQVLPGTKYSPATGYGFESTEGLTGYGIRDNDSLYDEYITHYNYQSFFFSVKLPEGNYQVKVASGCAGPGSVTTIRAECRRLMVEKAVTLAGDGTTSEFTVHIRDSMIRTSNSKVRLKPREYAYLHWDDKLTLEFSGGSKICAVEITPVANIPVMFLAGNSTVVDQAQEPWAAWGQMIPVFFQPGKIVVANYAESGETLKAFKAERRLEKIWSMAKPGDYLFIEFTHNDQKPGGNFLDPFTTYQQTLKEWIAEARSRAMIPVLVTSMHRRTFDTTGHITNSLGDYPEAMRQTAREENVPLIDLNAMSKQLYEAWGPERSIKAFVHYPANTFPDQPNELKDNTHFSTYGAYQLAKCVVNGIKENIPGLANKLKQNLAAYSPLHPDPFEKWSLPLGSFSNIVKPDGN